jgi:hypothetical protein
VRRILLSIATVAVVAAVSGAEVSAIPPTPWKMEPYYEAVNSELWLVSYGGPGGEKKCAWTGAWTQTNSLTQDFKLWGCARPSYIWAKTCTKAAQTVSFTKRIFVPGAPNVFEVSLGSYKNTPLKELDLLVNGGTALRATHSVHKVDLKGRAGLFKFGWNVLTVTARKPATKEKCDQPEYAVAFEIHAAFRADLVAKSPVPAQSTSALLIDEVTITNKGPSSTLFGTVSFSAGTIHLKRVIDKYVILSTSPIGPPLADDCMYYSSSTYCPMPGLDPGESFHFYAHYIYDAPLPPAKFYEEFLTQWGVSQDTLDPLPANNGGKRYRGVCRQDAPPPCKKP